jgi:hypothetical protein
MDRFPILQFSLAILQFQDEDSFPVFRIVGVPILTSQRNIDRPSHARASSQGLSRKPVPKLLISRVMLSSAFTSRLNEKGVWH